MVGVYVLLMAGFLNPYTGKIEKTFQASVENSVLGKIYRFYFDPQHSWESYERIWCLSI
jgi:hypothetical protein